MFFLCKTIDFLGNTYKKTIESHGRFLKTTIVGLIKSLWAPKEKQTTQNPNKNNLWGGLGVEG